VADRLRFRPAGECRYDAVSLGEVMLRLDPGDLRIRSARSFRVWEGGGEYNVARNLRTCFGLRTAVVTALVDNEIGRLVESLISQGGVDTGLIRWHEHDGIGRSARNGINFTERGFGVRAALGVSDRGNTAISHLRPTDIDWEDLFGRQGVRWFHTGGIFAGLGEQAPDVVELACRTARRYGTVVSYDINYRPSVWAGVGGEPTACLVNHRLVDLVDVVFGIGPGSTPIAEPIRKWSEGFEADVQGAMAELLADHPGLSIVATTLHTTRSASRNDWGAVAYADGCVHRATSRDDLEIFDRVGAGDAFAAGLIGALLADRPIGVAVEYGAALGALTMTTAGDVAMASQGDVERLLTATEAGLIER